MLEQARSYGDILIVGVQSDESVRAAHAGLRGSGDSGVSFSQNSRRPITPAAERAEILAALAAVDYVVEFEGPSARKLIEQLKPDIVVKGASVNPSPAEAAEDRLAEANGVKIVRILLDPGYSTTLLIERITQARA